MNRLHLVFITLLFSVATLLCVAASTLGIVLLLKENTSGVLMSGAE